jgi:hypothetical protein
LTVGINGRQAEKNGNCNAVIVATLALHGRVKLRQERFDLHCERGAISSRLAAIFDG